MVGRAEDGSDGAAVEQEVIVQQEEVVEGAASEEQEAKDDSLEDDDHEGADARILPDPGEPTPSQVEDHRASGHIPYRAWCRECVEGRGTG